MANTQIGGVIYPLGVFEGFDYVDMVSDANEPFEKLAGAFIDILAYLKKVGIRTIKWN